MPPEVTTLLEPIPGSNPCGVDLRYEPVYDQIKQARIEEDDLPTGGLETARKTADYKLVVRLATETLSKKSKDLQIAAWLTEAWLKREGFAGLASGLKLLRSLVETFWDHVYPELDEDGDAEFRAAPLRWIAGSSGGSARARYLESSVRLVPITAAGHTIEQYHQALGVGHESDATSYDARDRRNAAIAAGQLTGEEFDAAFAATPKAFYKQLVGDMSAALEELDGLDLVCQERFADAAPNFSTLRSAISTMRQEVQPLLAAKLELEPDPVEEVPAETELTESALGATPATNGAGAGGTGPAAQAASASIGAVPRTRADAEARIAAAARYLRTEAPAEPGAYLLLRGLRWSELRSADDGIDPRVLAAPPTETRAHLKRLLLDERWRELLEAGEEVMATPLGRAWLDLQRYTLTACDALGEEYAPVGAGIRSELRTLLSDIPGLPAMTLIDDTPAANAETRAWLRAEGLLPGEAAAEPAAPARRFRRDPAAQAEELVRSKQTPQAIELLMRAAEQERSARGRFLRRSQAAGIMVESGLDSVALPILQELAEQIETHGLEQWEDGETIARVLGLLYRSLLKMGDPSTAQGLYLRICRLDPVQAMQLPPIQ